MGFLSSAISAAAGGLTNWATKRESQNYQWKRDKRMYEWQTAYNDYMAKNKYQIQAADAEAAGYNPALPITAGGSMGTAGNPAGAINGEGIDTIGQMINAASAISNMKQQEAQAELLKIQAAGVAKNNGWIDKKANAEIKNLTSDAAKKIAETSRTRQEIKKIKHGAAATIAGTEGSSALYKMGETIGGKLARFITSAGKR